MLSHVKFPKRLNHQAGSNIFLRDLGKIERLRWMCYVKQMGKMKQVKQILRQIPGGRPKKSDKFGTNSKGSRAAPNQKLKSISSK